MSIKTKLTIEWQSYQGTLTNYPSDADKISKYVEETDVTQVFRQNTVIANGATNQAITLPAATTDYLLIFTDQSITIKLNSGATIIKLDPRVATEKCPALAIRGEFTALTISNASGTAANVDIIMAVI